MFKLLWSHTRSIDVSVFSDKVVYRIPLYSDFIFKNAKIEYCHAGRELKLTTYQEPTVHHSEVSSSDNQLNLKVLLDESDKYLPSHQSPCRKTKSDSCSSPTISSLLS